MSATPESGPSRREFCRSLPALLAGGGLLAGGARAGVSAGPHAAPGPAWIDVTTEGLRPDGRTKITPAVNEIIRRRAAAGGGTLYFPPGIYLAGAIQLRSNITLHLEAGATIRFSADFADFLPMVPSRWQGLPLINFSPLLYARDAHHIAITGRGTLDGSGEVWWNQVKSFREAARTTGAPPPSPWRDIFLQHNPPEADQSQGFHRPSLFQALGCHDVRLEGVRFENSPFWTVHFVDCEDVVVDGVGVYAPRSAVNTDGINPESSRNVRIANCVIAGHDDCIAIKSGKEPWGREHARPSENITITNCVMRQGVAGVAIGSETSGSVRRVVVSNCVFEGTGRGIHVKTRRGRGGVIEDLLFSNLVMHDLQRGVGAHPGAAVLLNLRYYDTSARAAAVDAGTPRMRNITIRGIRATGAKRAVVIDGLEEMPIGQVALDDLDIEADEGLSIRHAENVRLSNLRLTVKTGIPFAVADTHRLTMLGCESSGGDSLGPRVRLNNVAEASVVHCEPFAPGLGVLAIEGDRTRRIAIAGIGAGGGNAGTVQVTPEVPPAEVTESR